MGMIINPYRFGINTLKNGLLGCWELDETSGSTAYDSLGISNGTIINVTINQSGKINKCYQFSGTPNNKIEIPHTNFDNIDGFNNSYTVQFWVKKSVSQGNKVIIEKGFPYPFGIRADTNYIKLVVYDGTYAPYVQIESTGDGNWHLIHMVVNYDTDKIIGYKDGQFVADTTNTITSSNKNTSDILVGEKMSLDSAFTGMLDQIAIWNRALTPVEISALYNSGNGLAYTSWA